MHFLRKHLQLFSSTIETIERQDVTAFEAKAEIDTVMTNFKIRQNE
jgi:hypothetical protein